MKTIMTDTAQISHEGVVKKKLPSLLITIILIVAIIAAMCAIYYFFYFNTSTTTTSKELLPKISQVSEIKNPMEFFYQNFSKKDYGVTLNVNHRGGNTFYYQKGDLIRIDGGGEYNSHIAFIIKNSKLYFLNKNDKTFVEMNIDDPQSTFLLPTYKVSSVFDPILEGETPTATPWTLASKGSADKNVLEYETKGRKLMSYLLPGNASLVDIKLTLNTQTSLITSISMKSDKDLGWHVVEFQYEEIKDIESLKTFPRDYKKVDSL